jgi:hypothetical protein
MAKSSTTVISLSGWCANPYRDARSAIMDLDISAHETDAPANMLSAAWTAIILLTESKGIPAAQWLPVMARFHKLTRVELGRVRDAIEMRLRAFERTAALTSLPLFE